MKIEKINDSTIRCTLSSLDLGARNMSLSELKYGSEKTKGLFIEMMQKAYSEVGFDANGIPLVIEAVPLSSESVMLEISKVESPEELDARFSRFAPLLDMDMFEDIVETAPLLEGAENVSTPQLLMQLLSGTAEPDMKRRVFCFDSLDHVTGAAVALSSINVGENSLYKNPSTGIYYLTVNDQDMAPDDFISQCNILSDYASSTESNIPDTAYISEHFECILASHALQGLQKLG